MRVVSGRATWESCQSLRLPMLKAMGLGPCERGWVREGQRRRGCSLRVVVGRDGALAKTWRREEKGILLVTPSTQHLSHVPRLG